MKQPTKEQLDRLEAAGFKDMLIGDLEWSDVLRLLDRIDEAEAQATKLAISDQTDRERMVYWLLRIQRFLERLERVGDRGQRIEFEQIEPAVERLLHDMGYPIYGDRAIQMISLGEPGKRR